MSNDDRKLNWAGFVFLYNNYLQNQVRGARIFLHRQNACRLAVDIILRLPISFKLPNNKLTSCKL